MRMINPNIWIDYTFNQEEYHEKIVISDCRQENELLRGMELGYFPIRVVADLDKRIQRVTERDDAVPDLSRFNHEAEKGADKYEMFTIDNNGTLRDLHKQIDKLIYGSWEY